MQQAIAASELIFLTINLAERKHIGHWVVRGEQESQSALHFQIHKQQHHPEPRGRKVRL